MATGFGPSNVDQEKRFMGRGLSVVGSQVAPFPGATSVKSVTPVNIPAAPTAPVEIAELRMPGGNVGKLILVSVTLVAGGDDTVSLHLFRNGVEIDATDLIVEEINTTFDESLAGHWYDDDPGAGEVTYSIRADSVNGLTTAGGRRATAMHAPGDTT